MNNAISPDNPIRAVGRWVSGALTPMVVAGAIIFIWEAATPASMSIARPIAEFSGVLEAEAMRVREEEEAHYTELIALAEERGQRMAQLETEPKLRQLIAYVDRMSRAYDSMWNAYGAVTQNVYAAETELARLQSRQIAGTQFVDQLVANGASALCYLGQFGESQDMVDAACPVSDAVRNGLAEDYVAPLQNGRTQVPRQLMSEFSSLQDMFVDDAARLRRNLEELDATNPR